MPVSRLTYSPALFVLIFLCACTASKTTTTTRAPSPKADTTQSNVDRAVSWLHNLSSQYRSLDVSGTITIEGEQNQSANFVMKSKRLSNASSLNRIDSLSIIVTGPFGITVARLLASPERYYFMDILHGDVREGPTDPKSLEELTQLKGVTLGTMDDIIYGLAPKADSFRPADSLRLYRDGPTNVLFVKRAEGYSEAIRFSGDLNTTDLLAISGGYQMHGYDAWRHSIPNWTSFSQVSQLPKPDIHATIADYTMFSGLPFPQSVTIAAGGNTVTLSYTDILLNPEKLTVRIKIPKQ